MADVKDISLDENKDLLIRFGDFDVSESDQEHIATILVAAPGTFKQFPLIGANINEDLNGPTEGKDKNSILRKIQIQLESDNYNIGELTMDTEGGLNINAERKL